VKKYELVSESEESLPDSESDSDSELDDCALPVVVVNGDIDDNEDIL
jgi:hypothetical protein